MGLEQDGGHHEGISFMKSSPVLVEIKIPVSFFSPICIKLPVLLQEVLINSLGIFQMEFSKIIIPPWKRWPRDPPQGERAWSQGMFGSL